jgi:uridylate kinase
MVKTISLGGSIVAPDSVDAEFVGAFASMIRRILGADPLMRLILVVGGGGPARAYQKAYRACVPNGSDDEQDWIGVAATLLNARFLKAVFADLCPMEVVSDPTAVGEFAGRVMVASGWKPGFSTDNDAVILAERFGAEAVINLSNIERVYTADPRTDPNARPLDAISWEEYRRIIGDEWKPGKNAPFDPVASKRAAAIGLRVIVAEGHDLANTARILEGSSFKGTAIG